MEKNVEYDIIYRGLNMNREKVFNEIGSLIGYDKVSISFSDLLIYSHDYSPINLHKILNLKLDTIPLIVIWPETIEDIVKITNYCYENNIPMYPYGGGSGVLNGFMPKNGVVVDLKRINYIELNEEDLMVTVGAGVNGMILEKYLNYKGYTLGHIPQSLPESTVGGWVATKATGQFSTKYGGIEDMLMGLKIVVPPGKILEMKSYPRTATGPDLRKLFIGSEGIFGIIVEATFKINLHPEKRIMISYLTPSFKDGLENVRNILRKNIRPAVIRIYDKIETLRHFYWIDNVKGKSITIFIVEGEKDLAEIEARVIRKMFRGEEIGNKPVKHWLKTRFIVKEASEYAPLGFVFDTIEVAASWSKISSLYDRVIDAMKNVEGTLVASAHASHFYPQGACLYFTFGGLPPRNMDPYKYHREVWSRVMNTVLKYGGTISHHHGIGRMRSPWLKGELSSNVYELLLKIKRLIDDKNIMNPGNMV